MDSSSHDHAKQGHLVLKRVLRLADLSEFLQKFPSAGAVLSLSVVMILATAISTTASRKVPPAS